MNDAGERANPSPSSVEAALLDYFSSPGKYQLVLREPAVLFASVCAVLQLAGGRTDASGADGEQLRQAAMFFVRAALLYPGGDHYAVFGLLPAGDAADLKDRYRLMMRLIHPDFAASSGAEWPADAAMRVNRAYEVLSSPVLRREYDEQLAANRGLKAAAVPQVVQAAPKPLRAGRPGRLSRKVGWPLGIVLAGLAIMLLLPRQEPAHLVQVSERSPLPAERAAPEPAGPAPVQERPAAAPMTTEATDPVLSGAAEAVVAAAESAAEPPASAKLPALTASRSLAPGRVDAPAGVRAAHAYAPSPVPARAVAIHPEASPLALARSALAGTASALTPRPSPPPVPPTAVFIPAAPPTYPPEPPTAAPAIEQTAPVATPTLSAAALISTGPLRLTPTVSLRPAPTLADAQPLLTQVLQMLETGSGEQVLRLLEPSARQAPGAQQLSQQFDELVHGARPVRLSHAEFQGEAREGVLLVTGRLRLHAGEPTIGSRGQLFLLHAEFAARNGKVMLTGLGGAPE